MDSLTPAKKAQLQEVADLMLEIYRTLVHMRYLDASWICQGPHDIDALLPTYRSSGLDDSVIYLYSILPYIDASGAAQVDFFQGGEFADFRKEGDVKQGRDPFYEDNEDDQLPPYMTPLSLLGNHRSVIFYNSRKHWIAIYDQESDGSSDHNIHEPYIPDENPYESDQDTAGGDNMSEDEEDGMDEEGGSEEDEIDEGEDEEEDSDEQGGSWDEMSSRPAGIVLCDIVRWHHDLAETPGGGEQTAQSGGGWDAELVKPLYRKHGWPGSHFDGDAFLVDAARADAARTANNDLTGEMDLLKARLRFDGPDGPNRPRMKQIEAAAETAEDLWVARWHLWHTELNVRRDTEALRRVEKRWDDAKREDLPLLREMAVLEERLRVTTDKLERAQQELRDAEASDPENVPGAHIRLRHAEGQVGIFQKAYEASRADADGLLSKRTSTPDPETVEMAGHEARFQQLSRDARENEREIESIRGWILQLPQGTDRARMLAQSILVEKERALDAFLEQRRGVAETLEKYKSEGQKEVSA